MNKGILIVFEGIDGSGKNSLRDLLYEQLTKEGYKVAKAESLTDDSITGSAIRKMLNTKQETTNDMRLALVYLSELVFNTEKPGGMRDLLDQGYTVLCNRYHYSTKAYAGFDGGEVDEIIYNVKEVIPKPDIVYYIDIDAKTAMKRLGGEGDFYEKEDKLTAIRNKYHIMCSENKDSNMLRVNNSGDISEAKDLISNIVANAITIKGIK